MNEKELLGNQLLTDIEIWLEDFGRIANDEVLSMSEEAKRILEKVKKYLSLK